jgi:outer membrane protein
MHVIEQGNPMLRLAFITVALASAAVPALAQSSDAAPAAASTLPDPNDSSDQLTIGVGGISFTTRGPAIEVNLIPRSKEKFSFSAGPIVALGLNRTGKIKDPLVALLPRRKKAIELGGFVGGSIHGLTNPYDSLGAKVAVMHDVGHAHRSTSVSPSVDFSTPLSRSTYVGLSAGLDFVSTRYAGYYFGVTPADAALSGLPAFAPKGGLKDWKVNLLAVQSLSGNLLKGLSLGGTLGYSRLQGDFKRSPLVAQRGKAGQWLGALGLGYSF